MGRGITFSYAQIEKPKPAPDDRVPETLQNLKEGQTVSGLTYYSDTPRGLCRSVSTYGKLDSPLPTPGADDITYVVDHTEYDIELFESSGLRAIVLRHSLISEDDHFPAWVITTDGYIRECENYGIIAKISSITVS